MRKGRSGSSSLVYIILTLMLAVSVVAAGCNPDVDVVAPDVGEPTVDTGEEPAPGLEGTDRRPAEPVTANDAGEANADEEVSHHASDSRPAGPPSLGATQQPTLVSGEFGVAEDLFRATRIGDDIALIVPVANGLNKTVPVEYEVKIHDLNGEELHQTQGAYDAPPGIGEMVVNLDGPAPAQAADDVRFVVAIDLSYQGIGTRHTRSLAGLLPAPMVLVQAPGKLYPAQPARIPVQVLDSRTNSPCEHCPVRLSVEREDGAATHHDGITSDDGTALVGFIPDSEGDITLKAAAHYPGASPVAVEFTASVQEETRVLLTMDKPLYQPGQTLHIRALALRRPFQTPLQEEDLLVEVHDPKGNKVFKEVVKTNRFGVAHTAFTLANQVNMGTYTVVTTAGDNRTEKTVDVRRYVLPKFKVTTTIDKDFYLPGQQVSGVVSAQYFFGKPVVGGQVKVRFFDYQANWVEAGVVEGLTDGEGMLPFSYSLPDRLIGQPVANGNALVLAEFAVTDTGEQEVSATRQISVAASPLSIAVFPESGTIVPGVANNFYLFVTDPAGAPVFASCSIHTPVNTAQPLKVELDGQGPGIFSITPAEERLSLVVQATANGASVTRELDFASEQKDARVLLRLDRSIHTVGETLVAEVLTAGAVGRAFLDLTRDGQTVATATIPLEAGQGRYQLDLDNSLSGALVVSAYALSQVGEYTRDSRVLFVESARDLTVTVEASKDQYGPAQTGRFKFAVTDDNAVPVQAALGVQVVDEAVFALSEAKPGLMKLFFALEKELLEPSYQVGAGVGLVFSDLLFGPVGEGAAEAETRSRKAGAALAAMGEPEPGKSTENSFPEQKSAMKRLVREHFDKWKEGLEKEALEKLGTDSSNCDKLDEIIRKLVEGGGPDPWGGKLVLKEENRRLLVATAGPDGAVDTWDDELVIFTPDQFCRPPDTMVFQGVRGFGGGDGMVLGGAGAVGAGAGGGMGGIGAPGGGIKVKTGAAKGKKSMVPDSASEDSGGSGEEVRVRTWFPETLFVEPALITDEKGLADLEIPLADSITTWRMSTVASDAGGRLGGTDNGITVFQDFFVDVDFPVFLTRNDELKFPVVVYNYLKTDQQVDIQVQPDDWFEALGSLTASLDLKPGEVKSLRFPVKVTKVGWHGLTVTGKGSAGLADAVERTVEVRPDGREVTGNWSAKFKGEGDSTATDQFERVLEFPEETVEGSASVRTRILPGLTTHVVQGMDSMLRLPGG